MRYGELVLFTCPSSVFSPMIVNTWPNAGTPSVLAAGVAARLGEDHRATSSAPRSGTSRTLAFRANIEPSKGFYTRNPGRVRTPIYNPSSLPLLRGTSPLLPGPADWVGTDAAC